MKILFYSPSFYPKLGGIETVADLLAIGLQNIDNIEITIYTNTLLASHEIELNRNYRIIRNSKNLSLIKLAFETTVFVLHGLSLKAIIPVLLFNTKVFVIHHIPYLNHDLSGNFLQKIKHFFAAYTKNIYVSNYLKNKIGYKGVTILNPYDESSFFSNNQRGLNKKVLFAGRLVSDKGVNVLIDAFKDLKELDLHLDIVGEGPELEKLIKQVDKLDLNSKISFLGAKNRTELAILMRDYFLLVIPSVWEEPFGIIALEGLASGCQIISTGRGGLSEAQGDFGFYYDYQNSKELAYQIILASLKVNDEIDNQLNFKLSSHHVQQIASQYYNIFRDAKKFTSKFSY